MTRSEDVLYDWDEGGRRCCGMWDVLEFVDFALRHQPNIEYVHAIYIAMRLFKSCTSDRSDFFSIQGVIIGINV